MPGPGPTRELQIRRHSRASILTGEMRARITEMRIEALTPGSAGDR